MAEKRSRSYNISRNTRLNLSLQDPKQIIHDLKHQVVSQYQHKKGTCVCGSCLCGNCMCSMRNDQSRYSKYLSSVYGQEYKQKMVAFIKAQPPIEYVDKKKDYSISENQFFKSKVHFNQKIEPIPSFKQTTDTQLTPFASISSYSHHYQPQNHKLNEPIRPYDNLKVYDGPIANIPKDYPAHEAPRNLDINYCKIYGTRRHSSVKDRHILLETTNQSAYKGLQVPRLYPVIQPEVCRIVGVSLNETFISTMKGDFTEKEKIKCPGRKTLEKIILNI